MLTREQGPNLRDNQGILETSYNLAYVCAYISMCVHAYIYLQG